MLQRILDSDLPIFIFGISAEKIHISARGNPKIFKLISKPHYYSVNNKSFGNSSQINFHALRQFYYFIPVVNDYIFKFR